MVARRMIRVIKAWCKFLSLTLIIMISLSSSSLANQFFKINTKDQEWAKGLATQTLKLTIEGIKQKYLALQRMLGVVSDELSDEEGLEELFKPIPIIRVFVSSSMSKQLLTSYAKEAEKYGAVLVFKGLPNGSWRELSELVHSILGDSDKVALQIDDEAFARFGISTVPSFVLSSDFRDNWQEESVGLFDKVNGNIGIRGALTLMAEQGDMSDEASSILAKRKN